jgi:hypothetical protein
MISSPRDWFVRLPEDVKRRLVADPYRPVPPDLLPAVTEAGALAVGEWWPELKRGPDGMYLPTGHQDFLRATALYSAWARARDAHLAENNRYVVVEPLDSPQRSREKVFDDVSAARFGRLEAEEVAARAAYEEFVRANPTTGYLAGL